MSETRKYADGSTYETTADCRKVDWEPWEERFLKTKYHTLGPEEIAKSLERTVLAVEAKARTLGLYKRHNPGPPKSDFRRPPAVYSNRNIREELLDKYAPLDKNDNA